MMVSLHVRIHAGAARLRFDTCDLVDAEVMCWRVTISSKFCFTVVDGVMQVTKVPADVQKERALEAKAANAARRRDAQATNNAKTRMKGKNKATHRHRKRQDNIIEVSCF